MKTESLLSDTSEIQQLMIKGCQFNYLLHRKLNKKEGRGGGCWADEDGENIKQAIPLI